MKFRLSVITAIAALSAWSLMSIGAASAAPVCFTPTWTSTPNSGSANITLTAICTPDIGYAINSISGYAWKKNNNPISGTGIQNTDTLNDGDTATYKVTATEKATDINNQVQTQQSNTGQVDVYASLPSCTLALSGGGGTSIQISSGSVTLVPTCTGVSVSNPIEWYANTADNPIPDPVGGVVTPPSGKTSYFVVGTNGYGIAASNNVDVTVTAATPVPACTSISPGAPSITQGSNSGALTATCSNSPTSYVWKLNNATYSNCTGSKCTIAAADLSSVGQYSVTVTANNGGGNGTTAAGATITVSAVTSGGGGGSCTTQVASWGPGAPGSYLTVPTNGALAVQIRGLSSGSSSIANVLNNMPSTVTKFMSISTTACDFTPASPCSKTSRSNTPIIQYGANVTTTGTCRVPANTTLYINIRNSNTATGADSCPSGTNCQVTVVY